MDIFRAFIKLIAGIPDWLSLLFSPIALIVCAVLLFSCKRKGWLRHFALAFASVGVFLVCCEGGASVALVWLGLFATEYFVIRGVFSLSPWKKRARLSREERIFEKFHLPLTEEVEGERIPKVTCFMDEEPYQELADSGLQVSHVLEQLKKLQRMKLSPADRLETDVIFRRVETFSQKRLTGEEMNLLNDCLATVLRLTAKYSL